MQNQDLFHHFSSTSVQKLVHLNANMLNHFAYLTPQELAKIQTPAALFEKQMELYMENSYHLMNYMQQLAYPSYPRGKCYGGAVNPFEEKDKKVSFECHKRLLAQDG